jgi:plastocyanin
MLNRIALSLALAPALASAGPVDIHVIGPGGQPVADAVVTVESARAPTGPIRFPWPMTVAQQNVAFVPHVLIVPMGASVAFPNLDRVRHHVYSFSASKRFELKLYGQDTTRTVTFDKPGVVAIGCNIHDRMSGYVVVVTTPYAAKTDAAGNAHIPDVPDGAATLALWSPAIRGPGNRIVQGVAVTPKGLSRTVPIG